MDALERTWFGVDEPELHAALESGKLTKREYIRLGAAALKRAREGVVLGELPQENSTPAFQHPYGITRRSHFAQELPGRGIENAQ